MAGWLKYNRAIEGASLEKNTRTVPWTHILGAEPRLKKAAAVEVCLAN